MARNLTSTQERLVSAHIPFGAYIVCGLHTVTNKRNVYEDNGTSVSHNTAYKRDGHNFTVSEFMLNNTVSRLVQGQGYKTAYKLVQTCAQAHKAEQEERVQVYVNIVFRLSNEFEYDNIITLAQDALEEFAEMVDGVTLVRVPVKDFNSNPAMMVKGSI